ncbi:molybdopterin-dependent oxidoreductase [Actinomycetospora sp. TBRC 11914]|uniref:molybdopterin-dependent oxidoreductase n=1 Tax=Actinomycetospora sp. TBRC 11914 TaxID=2729387 RepID=UPI00145DCACD|nr:molybdopterin-dependent oxidoreductase [Actinomycetospora sp. TBRC 11914]NMO93866.1 molybdopterin-dependent oxidoreductase [Actinomycetospora sp. TBRC 11914]
MDAARMAPAGTIKRQRPPEALGAPVTAVDDLYLIGHFGIAHLSPETWRLRVDGRVRRPLELDLDALRAMPGTTVTAVLECFGNPLLPREPTRRAGNVVWRGTPVSAVLDLAGADGELLWAQGYDSGVFDGRACTEYLKDLPLAVVRERGLLAYEMNGEPLTVEHGAPVRLFVPGYFGTNNVKWLRSLTVADHRAEHLFTTELYQRLVGSELRPVRDLDVTSLVTDVRRDGPTVRVEGWAWGSSEVVGVEVQALGDDDGEGWVRAELAAPVGGPYSWRRFRATVPSAGTARVRARARDATGARQPLEGDRNACHVVDVDEPPDPGGRRNL